MVLERPQGKSLKGALEQLVPMLPRLCKHPLDLAERTCRRVLQATARTKKQVIGTSCQSLAF